MTPVNPRNALEIHGWLRSYEAGTAVKDADGIRAKPIQPFRAPKTEQQIAELYCGPRAYYHCVEFLLEAPKGLFTFDELNERSKWQDAISKYLALTGQGELSLAAKQLHRLVEKARKEFREAQDRAWRNRKLADRPPEDYERREAAAWLKFSKVKEVSLQRYNRAIGSGVVKRVKRKKARLCPVCDKEPLRPRQRKCDECRRETRRKRNRRYYAWSRNRSKTGSLLGIGLPKLTIPLLPPLHNQ